MKDNVFRFDISVNNLLRVKLGHRLANLAHIPCHLVFMHGVALFKQFEELAAHAKLQNDVNIGNIIEISVHFHYIGVIKKQLDFELPDKLLCNVFLS